MNRKSLFMRTQSWFLRIFTNQNAFKFDLRMKDRKFYEPFLERLNHHVYEKALGFFMFTQNWFLNVFTNQNAFKFDLQDKFTNSWSTYMKTLIKLTGTLIVKSAKKELPSNQAWMLILKNLIAKSAKIQGLPWMLVLKFECCWFLLLTIYGPYLLHQ